MKYKLVILGRLPGLNEYVNACRSNRYLGATMKKKAQKEIAAFIEAQLPNKFNGKVKAVFKWYEPNERRDYDNICFAKKFILDALQETGRLENDNRKNVAGFTDEFYVDRQEPRIEIEITELQGNKK